MISVDGIVLTNRPLLNLEITDSVQKLRIFSFRGCSFEMRYWEHLTKMSVVF